MELDKWIAICTNIDCDRWGFPGGTSGEESTCQCRRCKRCRFDPWVRKIPGVGNGNLLQYSSWENSMDRGAWQAMVHRVAKESDTTECTHTHTRKFQT